jgi:hypothetical protein
MTPVGARGTIEKRFSCYVAAVSLRKKNPHAVALGKKGGKTGGVNRWKNVPAEERSRILRAAIQARWAKKKPPIKKPPLRAR